MSLRFVGRDDLTAMLRRQGPREDISGAEIDEAYLDRYGKGDSRFGVIGGFWKDTLLGVTSFGVIANRNVLVHTAGDTGDTAGRRYWYGRIDVAVVPPEYRGFGVSRWLLEANLLYMIEAWPGELYSFSTIAAHKAIAYILSLIGFSVAAKEGMVEERVSLEIDVEREPGIRENLKKKTGEAERLVFFRIRQRGGL